MLSPVNRPLSLFSNMSNSACAIAFGKWIARTIPCSMVGATLPTAPSVRIANSRQFSMLNRKCDHCLRSSVRVHFVSARPEVRRFLLAKRILYIHYVFLPLFSREQYGPFPCRLRLVFVSSPCLAGRLTLFIYYLLAFRHDYFPVAVFFTIYTAHNTLFLKSRQFSFDSSLSKLQL